MTHRSAIAQQAAAPDLLGWWYSDSLTGGALTDRTGNGGHAALIGNASVSGGCLTLLGGEGAAVVPVDLVGGLTKFTFATWINLDTAGHANYGNILGTGDGSPTSWNFTCGIAIKVAGVKKTANFGHYADVWRHYAATVRLNGTNAEVAMYLNGGLLSIYGQPITASVIAASTYTAIGGFPSLYKTVPGYMDDIRIYASAKTASEITAIYAEAIHP